MQESLQRVLGTPAVLLIGINAVVGGGVFLLPGQLAAEAGALSVFAYLAAGLLVMLMGLSYSEVGTMFSRTGGPVVYAQEAMGRTVGFSVGWMTWMTYLAGWSVLANGFVDYLSDLVPGIGGVARVLIIAGIIVILCLLNTLGVRLGSGVIQVFSVAKLVPLLVLVVAGLTFAGQTGNAGLGAVPVGAGGFLAAVSLTIFAFGGFEGTTVPSGEMRNPGRAISVAVLGTLGGVTVFYMLIQYASLRIQPGLAETGSPLTSVGAAMFTGGLALVTIGALISIFGTQSGVALTAPRNLYALSREGMLPDVLSRVHPRLATPVVATWVTGGLVLVLATTGTFEQLLLLNVAARLYQYLMVCLSAAILRLRRPEAERPFRLPLGPAIPAVAAVLSLALLVTGQDAVNLLAAAVALGIGLLLYIATRLAAARNGDRGDSESG
ncbi:APC family permease [Rubrobacter aplysinae]|uniref:APC family permease n=1 Tax=Rubrobacter aplysinae TaxID=909625 RepID=UPI00064C13A4|nr:APC family permease [Rubrobacter aplysinae]